ncbi:prepilin-type N-terminal cleavage/methylation domain-containing protein [Ostreibacterium oceani]|uniref:Prepilin-type N-terminal cleavage/methylation domain-containing protein n=1 Tax=Ostreibacterium oceani TaxID=2654998 RepID=A0A6N7ERU5_9GAMM|nr:prepilin-type N-terminal cleavage/methylation domain-containing protein [Ostreibacterium oceani]MPV85261.1 prepilin-type N-terminal cleavage/methylation domain-containing protein [Ostreibacterium oceani]
MSKQATNLNKASVRGFTLIEVAIVIAIIGILTAIAIPSYENYMRKVTLKKMTAKMQEVALALEKNYAICNRYNINCTTRAGFLPNDWNIPLNADGSGGYPGDGRAWGYGMQVNLARHQFIIIATPNARQGRHPCQIISLDSDGFQYAAVTSPGNALPPNYAAPNLNDSYHCWN